MAFADLLCPAALESGFRMEGYHVWCGSPIRGEDGRYYLFASRWPEETRFPEGYMHHSEIVLAVADDLSQPFQYVKTVISKRDRKYWDGEMAHNPQILKVNGEYLLFYIGSPDGRQETRAIGMARSSSLTGEFHRPDYPLQLPPNANNPAVCQGGDGCLYMAFRDGKLRMSIARAAGPDAPFETIAFDLFPGIRVEDPFLFYRDGHFEMLAEDNQAGLTGHSRWGAHLRSEDGVRWEKMNPPIAYDHTLRYGDGSCLQAIRRERPQLLFDENGKAIALFNGVLAQGKNTWNYIQPIDRY
ncbi:MAG: hypothetical protein E7329_02770 [Clostridiales bacterium]|nr:hypothetical protein [Clostridiales bacterium]